MAGKTDKKPSRFWYVLDFIFLGIIIPCFVYGICMPSIYYRCGLENNANCYTYTVMTIMYIGIPFIIAIIGELIMIFEVWPRRIKSERNKDIVPVLAFLILFSTPIGIIIYNITPDDHYMKGFGEYIQKNINISDVREWLETVPPEVWEDYGKQLVSFPVGEEANWLSSQPMIQSISQLSPPYIFVYKDGENNGVINIAWGGGFMHWGVIIGNENTLTTEEANNRGHEPTRKIQNGVYSYVF